MTAHRNRATCAMCRQRSSVRPFAFVTLRIAFDSLLLRSLPANSDVRSLRRRRTVRVERDRTMHIDRRSFDIRLATDVRRSTIERDDANRWTDWSATKIKKYSFIKRVVERKSVSSAGRTSLTEVGSSLCANNDLSHWMCAAEEDAPFASCSASSSSCVSSSVGRANWAAKCVLVTSRGNVGRVWLSPTTANCAGKSASWERPDVKYGQLGWRAPPLMNTLKSVRSTFDKVSAIPLPMLVCIDITCFASSGLNLRTE